MTHILLDYINTYSAGSDFRRQNLMAIIDPRTVRLQIFLMAVDP